MMSAELDTLPADSHTPAEPKERRKLRASDIALIWRWHQEGRTQAFIANKLGCHQTTISKQLTALDCDTTDVARQLLRAKAYRAATRISALLGKENKVGLDAAKFTLQANNIGVDRESAGTVQVLVNVGLPGLPTVETAQAKVIDAQASAPAIIAAQSSQPVDSRDDDAESAG